MKTYSIRQVSQLFHLPASTLRYYEDAGLLTEIARSEAGQRVYEEKHLNRLRTICCFKGTGMSIAQLKTFFALAQNEPENIDAILALLEGQKSQVESQLAQLRHDYAHVQRKLAYYAAIRAALAAGTALPAWADYRDRRFD